VQAGDGDTFAVNYVLRGVNAYTTSCTTVAGEVVVTIRPAGAQAARPLAFTGSNDTTQYVLIGAGLLAVGSVLVVGARRRNRVRA
ncbi:MAG TPA: LPXTG cell wall anchor domain-containing protein, partial [Acidimicrobiia bacterium]|nr:LPXTG cell wall anchor domain-containing protein [Acidimicrobiia bacterium]